MEAEGLLAQLSSRETYSENEGSSLKNLFTYWFKEELFAKKNRNFKHASSKR